MTSDEGHALADQLVRHSHGLLRIAGVVAHDQFELLAVHAALGVEILDRQLGATLHLLTKRGVLTGDRTDDGDRDVGLGRRHRTSGDRSRGDKRKLPVSHFVTLPVSQTVDARGAGHRYCTTNVATRK